MTKKIRIGIIGCGGIATNKHMPTLSQIETVDLYAFCDVDIERARTSATKFGTKEAVVYETYQQLLTDPSIDVVHVCTSNDSHAEISIAAMEAGKHVLCEKPMAKYAADALKMLEVAKRTGKKLSIGYNNRFRPDSQLLYKACRNDELGEIYFAKAHAVRRRGVPNRGAFLNDELQGGGPLIDIGTHALDLTLWMMDNYKPKSVLSTAYYKLSQMEEVATNGGWNPQDFTVEDSAFGMIVMENGASIMVESSWALNIRQEGAARVTLCGTKAGADMWDGLWINGEEKGSLYNKQLNVTSEGIPSFEKSRASALGLEMRTWIDAIRYDTDLVVKPEQALVVSQILEAMYESSKTGKAVYFS